MWIRYNWLILLSTSSWILLYVIQISSSESSLSQTLLHCLQFVMKVVSLLYTEKRAFMTADWSMTEWNTLWIPNSVFRQKKCELIFLTMMYLTFFALNFLHKQSVCMFLSLVRLCLLSWSHKTAVSLICHFFCICWVTVIVICTHSVTSFIFCTIWSAFCTELLQIVQASTSQVVVETSCDTHETRKRSSSLLRQSHDCLWLAQSWEAGLLSCSDYNWRNTNVQLNILIHSLSCSVSFWVICCEHSLYNLQSWQTLHRLLTNWVSQSETIAVKSSWAQ
jgi:hypothetical protein